MRSSFRLALVLACLVAAQPARAETSSWFGGKDEPKTAPSKPKKPAAEKPAASQKTPQAPNTSSHAKTTAPASGDDAAYIAFDQGQYLTALALAEAQAARGEPQAHTLIGRIYAEGLGVGHDDVVAARWYARGAELGDTEAPEVAHSPGRGSATSSS